MGGGDATIGFESTTCSSDGTTYVLPIMSSIAYIQQINEVVTITLAISICRLISGLKMSSSIHVQEDQVTGLKKQNIAAEHLSSTQPAAVKAKVAR